PSADTALPRSRPTNMWAVPGSFTGLSARYSTGRTVAATSAPVAASQVRTAGPSPKAWTVLPSGPNQTAIARPCRWRTVPSRATVPAGSGSPNRSAATAGRVAGAAPGFGSAGGGAGGSPRPATTAAPAATSRMTAASFGDVTVGAAAAASRATAGG